MIRSVKDGTTLNVITALAVATCMYFSGGVFAMDYGEPSGWYFYGYEDIDVEEELPEIETPEVVPALPESTEEIVEDVAIDSAWLIENLPKLQYAAMDDPTIENVRRYMYAQRIALDISTRFAMVYETVSRREDALNENLRRQANHPLATQGNQRRILQAKNKLFTGYNDQVGLMFFFSGSCTYCEQMARPLEEFVRRTGVEVVPVSLDGQPLSTAVSFAEDYIVDDGRLTDVMPVDVTPTFYLVNKENGDAAKMSIGFQTQPQLEEAMLFVMHEIGIISESEYQSTKEVHDILLADYASDPMIMINEEELYDEPDYLADKLRASFEEKYLNPESDFVLPSAVVTHGEVEADE
ncbi:conjugal transfer protein TraF [Photobacterium sp. ZSDE20]|uniref:Conjugal transfer protein TraF n=1 Tax=Photobacterium pectinilyticum TaxID=2906793 RepID=A0ABT1N0Z6_9GAMM|nr:conjugal transfer protein TraF [Photobacterium sp. ZSDE20]MCQ1058408.1 conjugal transfer protein TraF [Photobacterium sp. ZSDE20]MDD1825229.1 conjugal transfer protein TraF [Photobacterium sp. ZSDE20]